MVAPNSLANLWNSSRFSMAAVIRGAGKFHREVLKRLGHGNHARSGAQGRQAPPIPA